MARACLRGPDTPGGTQPFMSAEDHAADVRPVARPAVHWRGLLAVIGSMTMMAMFYGYTGPLLSIVLEANGVSGSLIGANAAVQMAAVFIILPCMPWLIRRFGPARVMAMGVVVALSSLALMGLFIDVWLWFPLRFLMGGAQSMMWTTGETWINHVSDDRTRGRTVSIFMTAIATGFAVGPFLQAWAGEAGHLPFVVGGMLALGCALPLAVSFNSRIDAEGRPSVRLHQFFRLAPVPMFSNLVFACVASSMMALLSVYGLRLGMERSEAVQAIGWMGWGGVVMPLLIGYVADKIDRRALLALFVAMGALACAALPWLAAMGGWGIAFLMLFGGLRSGHYGIGVMLLGERFRGADLPSATAVFGFMFGCGSLIGPALAGIAMDLWDPHGLPAVIALFYLVFLPVPILAWWHRRAAALRARQGETLDLGG